MKNGFIKKFSDSKNVKYTTVNLAFCALVIGIVIVLNAMFTVFSEKFNWYLDMTDEGIFTMSDKFETAVEDALDGNDTKIEIIFAAPYSDIKDAFETTTTTGAIGYVNATAEQLAAKFDDIELTYHDIRKSRRFSPPGEMRPISAEVSRGYSHLTSGTSKGPSHPCCNSRSSPTYPSPLERKHESPAHIQRSPVSVS